MEALGNRGRGARVRVWRSRTQFGHSLQGGAQLFKYTVGPTNVYLTLTRLVAPLPHFVKFGN